MLANENLLLVGPYPPPYGGISSFITELERGCRDSVKSFHVLHIGDQEASFVGQGSAKVRRVKARSRQGLRTVFSLPLTSLMKITFLYVANFHRGPFLYLSFLVQAALIAHYCKENHITVISIFGTRQGGVIPFLNQLIDVPVCYCVFADPFKSPDFYAKHNRWFTQAFETATKVFSSSEYCCKVTQYFSSDLEAEVIYVGVDTSKFSPELDPEQSRSRLDITLSGTIILAVARMEKEMGIHDVLKVAEQILQRDQDAGFLIVGASGSETKKVMNFAARYSGRVTVRTDVPFDDLPLYYSSSSVVVAPTVGKHACMGVSVKEAMASGKPTVVSDSGGLPEAVCDGYNGTVVAVTEAGTVDVSQFTEALLTLIKNDGLRRKFGENARRRAIEIFSSEASVRKFETMVKQALAGF